MITCEEITEETKTVPKILMKKKVACKTQISYIFLAFLLIFITLLIAVSIYCYLRKYQTTQKHLLSFHITNNKPKEFDIDNIN